MEQKFDYNKALGRLDEIVRKIEDPQTSLDEIGDLVVESRALAGKCREYLRTVRESIEEKTQEDTNQQ